MPLVQTRGAASAQGFGEFAQAATVANYIEDVFSTYLYTGTGATQTITNGIDLSTKGGLTWIKGRSGATGHRLTDTARGVTKSLASETTAAEATETTGLTAFGTTGFTIGADADYNTNAATYVSWTFRKQPKFFDIVTWTGNGTNQNIPHNLGSVPACILVKSLANVNSWAVYHRSVDATSPQNYGLFLNTTDAKDLDVFWNNTAPTSTQFTVGAKDAVNRSGGSFVAYLFAHDAGGFGLTGTDNVISCGSFTTDGSGNATVSLGYEPQWVMIKRTDSTSSWTMIDIMRGYTADTASTVDSFVVANTPAAEVNNQALGGPNATGFISSLGFASATYIYIAIRRGPMKVPTLGTSVYNAVARTGTGAVAQVTGVGFTPDWVIAKLRAIGDGSAVYDRLRGNTKELCTAETADEYTITDGVTSFNMDGVSLGADATNGRINYSPRTYINWFFKRAPSFMDVVCYTGTGSATTQTHNLGVVPELMIVKRRNVARYWAVYASPLGATKWLELETQDPVQTDTMWNDTTPTASVFSIGTYNGVNGSGDTYVAYLFATCAGVSKVGSYTGTGTTKQIDCGFTGGARFVLIKRTDSTGGWYVWDTARGIVSGNDPYLLLNSTAAEVTSTDYIDTYNAGFEISSTAPAAINASTGTFIFLAIA